MFRDFQSSRFAILIVLLLAGCGGGGSDRPPPPSPPIITIADPMAYLAQTQDGAPLRSTDPMTYRRFDFGHYQASDSFLTGPTSAITTWSYNPFGPFVDANGDGGERYELQGDTVRITHTKHGGIPTTPISWVALTTATGGCEQGWTTYSPIERGCRAAVNYPGIGPVDTVISEHRFGDIAERIFLARGWGRLAWQTFRTSGQLDDPTRCPDFGHNAYEPGWTLTDCRYSVLVEPANGTLTGAQEWHP